MNLSNGTTTSSSVSKLIAKLDEIQQELKLEANVDVKVENSRGEHYQFSFADLKKVMETIKPALRKKNLVVWQVLEGELAVRTTLVDRESEEWISSVVSIPIIEQKAVQFYGSVITYLRRYSLTTMLGLVNDTDDDGNQHDNNKTTVKKDGKPLLTYEVMVSMINEIEKGNIKEVEKQMNKYSLNESQKVSLTTLLNGKKAEATLKQIITNA